MHCTQRRQAPPSECDVLRKMRKVLPSRNVPAIIGVLSGLLFLGCQRSEPVRNVIQAAYVDLITNPEKYYDESVTTHAALSYLEGRGYYLSLRKLQWGSFDEASSIRCLFDLRPDLEEVAEELLRDSENGITVRAVGRFGARNPNEKFPVFKDLYLDVIEMVESEQRRMDLQSELNSQNKNLEPISRGNEG